jgi:cyclophilin family peptidyl-prolyl cis-trans isomerase
MSSKNLVTASLVLSALGFAACGGNESKPTVQPETAQASKDPMSTPKAEAPKAEPMKAEAPKAETPKAEPAKAEAPKAETPKPDAPKPDAPKPDAPKPASSGDAAIDAARAFIATQKFDKTAKDWKTKVTQPPKLTFEAGKKYFWLLNTSEGAMKVRLMPDVAPMHVSSTIYLTEIGFYDELAFHRVIKGFMAQGGDPLGNGTGGPAYKYAGEFSPNAKHTKAGMLSMANAGPNTDGSQFFITFGPTPHLDGKHTIFGEVVDGMDTLKKLESFGSQAGPTQKPLKIVTAKIAVE